MFGQPVLTLIIGFVKGVLQCFSLPVSFGWGLKSDVLKKKE